MSWRVKPWATMAYATEVRAAVEVTAPTHRHLVYAIVDDDWQFVAVACDLPRRVPPEYRGTT